MTPGPICRKTATLKKPGTKEKVGIMTRDRVTMTAAAIIGTTIAAAMTGAMITDADKITLG